MSEVDPNPYSPPSSVPDQNTFATRWRVIPAAGSFLVGLASFAIGVFAVAIMAYVLSADRSTETVIEMLAGCTLYLGFGAAWMVAGWLHWKSRHRDGLIANGIGILIPVILFSILGF